MSHEIVDGCVSGRDLDRQRDTFPGHRTLPEANSPRNRESARGFTSRRFSVFALVRGTFVRERGVEAL